MRVAGPRPTGGRQRRTCFAWQNQYKRRGPDSVTGITAPWWRLARRPFFPLPTSLLQQPDQQAGDVHADEPGPEQGFEERSRLVEPNAGADGQERDGREPEDRGKLHPGEDSTALHP